MGLKWRRGDTEAYRSVNDAGQGILDTWEKMQANKAYEEASGITPETQAMYGGEGSADITGGVNPSDGVIQTRYGLGPKPTEFQDTRPTSRQQMKAGIAGLSRHYAGRDPQMMLRYAAMGDTMDANDLQRTAMGLQIDAARTANETRQRQLGADADAANWQQFGAAATSARDTGQLRGLGQELKAKAASGEITPEQYQSAMGQLNTTYGREGAERGLGAAVTRGYGYKEGMNVQNAAHAQAKTALMEKAGAYASKGDWKGLADFFTNNDNYSDGRAYQFIGTTKEGKVTIASTDADGKVVGTASMDPAELMAKVEAGLDPTKAGEYFRASAAAKKADQQFEITMKKMEQQHADAMTRLGAYTKALGQKEIKTTPELDARIKAGYAELHALQDPARAEEPGIKTKIAAAEHRVRGSVQELAVMNKDFRIAAGSGTGKPQVEDPVGAALLKAVEKDPANLPAYETYLRSRDFKPTPKPEGAGIKPGSPAVAPTKASGYDTDRVAGPYTLRFVLDQMAAAGDQRAIAELNRRIMADAALTPGQRRGYGPE